MASRACNWSGSFPFPQLHLLPVHPLLSVAFPQCWSSFHPCNIQPLPGSDLDSCLLECPSPRSWQGSSLWHRSRIRCYLLWKSSGHLTKGAPYLYCLSCDWFIAIIALPVWTVFVHVCVYIFLWLFCCSVSQSCPTLCDPWTAACQVSLSLTISWRLCSNSCPLSQRCHPTISSSVIPFSSCLQSFPASGSFLISQLFASGGQSIGASASASVLDCLPLIKI